MSEPRRLWLAGFLSALKGGKVWVPQPEEHMMTDANETNAHATTVRMAYSGNCTNSECIAIYVVAPHDETPNDVADRIAEGPNEWESFTDCFVCGSSIDWNGNDYLPVTIR